MLVGTIGQRTHICPVKPTFLCGNIDRGDVFVEQFTPDCVDDPNRIELSRKIKVFHDQDIKKEALGIGIWSS